MKKNGFQLLELLITLAILGILAALSMPIYSQYITHERRLEAAEKLANLALAMEQYHMQNASYQNVTLEKLHFPESIVKNYYRLVIISATDQEYVLAAKPQGKQIERDQACATLLLSSKGERQISGSGKVTECW